MSLNHPRFYGICVTLRLEYKKSTFEVGRIYRLQVPPFLGQTQLDGIGETNTTKVLGTNPSGAGTDGYMGLLYCSRGVVCIVIRRPVSQGWNVLVTHAGSAPTERIRHYQFFQYSSCVG